MTTEEIYARLRELAPNVLFSASKQPDPDIARDELDGTSNPDLDPYSVTISARCIIGGREYEGNGYLGGVWMEYDEPIDDLGGYLLQKLEEATVELKAWAVSKSPEIVAELDAVLTFLKEEMHRSYEEQMNHG